VLEVGAGTGANLLYYGQDPRTLTFTEPEKPMARRLQKRILERRPDVTLLRAPAEDLPFNDNSFDTVVATLVLCAVDDQPRALRELRRVLRPGGRLLSSSTSVQTTRSSRASRTACGRSTSASPMIAVL
jgi:ubiquinone/menaquinone biosynthesis C-methylase UbiE